MAQARRSNSTMRFIGKTVFALALAVVSAEFCWLEPVSAAPSSAAPSSAAPSSAAPSSTAPTAGEVAVARRLFNEAAELQEQKRWAAAADKLREAIKIKDTPGLRYHLAYCEDQLGQLVEAQVDYDRAAELIRAGAHAPDVEALLIEARASLARRVPSLTVSLAINAEVSRLTVDERDLVVALIGEPIPLNPGEHRVRIEARGYEPFEQTVELAIGEQETLSANLKPAPASAQAAVTDKPPAEVEFQERDSGWGAKEFVLLGEGIFTAGAAGLGIFATIKRSDAKSRQDEAIREADDIGLPEGSCSNPSPANAQLCDDLSNDEVRKWETLLFVGYGAAAAGGIAMVITALVWDSGSGSEFGLVGAPSRHGFWYGVNGRF